MTGSNTILESGITSLTRPVGQETFSFDEATRKMELVQFFYYCKEYDLITTSGEQSRLALMRKTYNHLLGANHNSSEVAERTWLQLETGNTSMDRETLWKSYFAQHQVVPDSKGLLYTALSLEGSYRRFLLEFIGDFLTYADNAFLEEMVSFYLSQSYVDPATISEIVAIVKSTLRSVSESAGASETVGIVFNRRLNDASNVSEATTIQLNKVIREGVAVSEIVTFTGMEQQTDNSLSRVESTRVSEVISISVVKVLQDIATVAESFYVAPHINMSDICRVNETFSYIIGLFQIFNEGVSPNEIAVILMQKNFFDSVTISEETITGYVGYNAGAFGDYYFGA